MSKWLAIGPMQSRHLHCFLPPLIVYLCPFVIKQTPALQHNGHIYRDSQSHVDGDVFLFSFCLIDQETQRHRRTVSHNARSLGKGGTAPAKLNRKVSRVARFRGQKDKFGLFKKKSVGLEILENLSSSWPFF